MIQIEHLCKSYVSNSAKLFVSGKKVLALDDISLSLDFGKALVLSGTKNSGKTSLLKVLATMLKPDSGTVKIFGADINKSKNEIRSQLVYLTNNQSFFNYLNVKEQLNYFANLKGLKSKELGERIPQLLKKWDLNPKQGISTLSSEEKMRLSLAQIDLQRPKLILFDEPALGLDVFTAKPIFDLIKEAKNEGTGIVYASSSLGNTEMFGDEIIFLHQGKLLYQSDMASFRQNCGNSFSDGFFKIISEANKTAV